MIKTYLLTRCGTFSRLLGDKQCEMNMPLRLLKRLQAQSIVAFQRIWFSVCGLTRFGACRVEALPLDFWLPFAIFLLPWSRTCCQHRGTPLQRREVESPVMLTAPNFQKHAKTMMQLGRNSALTMFLSCVTRRITLPKLASCNKVKRNVYEPFSSQPGATLIRPLRGRSVWLR